MGVKFAENISHAVMEDIRSLSVAAGTERGAVFTKPSVVDFILDCAGYVHSKKLYTKSILEPCFGEGVFLNSIVSRLLKSFFEAGFKPSQARSQLSSCVLAIELHQPTHERMRRRLIEALVGFTIPRNDSVFLADTWLQQGDFLLTKIDKQFDYVIGNPPYLRQEAIPGALLKEYRSRYTTLFDRADLYILFFERGLKLLAQNGRLGYICSDRWMKNQYGKILRGLIAKDFHLERFINMFGYPAFHDEVSAYTAITIIANQKTHGKTEVAFSPQADLSNTTYKILNQVAIDEEPWMLEEGTPISLLRELESKHPKLEDAGCHVGIGIATGNDSIYIAKHDELPIEEDRKMRLIMRSDLGSHDVTWSGSVVINIFEKDGTIIDLKKYPRLKRYFEKNSDLIKKRNVAKRNKINWFRTIDRIDAGLATKPKLLIPDIGDQPNIVHEKGLYYPHHNLYFVTSEIWDLDVLKALLVSGVAKAFIKAYSVKMRGGYVRYQAQYLRKIRLPDWHSLSSSLKSELASAARANNISECTRLACLAYGLKPKEAKLFIKI